jgi:hypothetical protein
VLSSVELAVVYICIESVFTDRDTRTHDAHIVQHLVNVNRVDSAAMKG